MGIIAQVVNARHVKNVPGRKTDMADAQWLATLARAGLLRKSFIPPASIRHLRLISRQRQKVVGILSSEKNRLGKVLADTGIRLNIAVSDIHGVSGRAMVRAIIDQQSTEKILKHASRLRASKEELFESLQAEDLTDEHQFVLSKILDHIEYLEDEIKAFDTELLQRLEQVDNAPNLLNLLQTVPGVDRTGAAMLLVEIGADMSCFDSAQHLASWLGICPGNNESAGKRKSGKTRKGNHWVRRLLCEFAQAAASTRCALKDKFQTLMIRKGYKKSIVALAHKMIRIIYSMLKSKTHYKDDTVDYKAMMAKKNAPRWIKTLVRYKFIELV